MSDVMIVAVTALTTLWLTLSRAGIIGPIAAIHRFDGLAAGGVEDHFTIANSADECNGAVGIRACDFNRSGGDRTGAANGDIHLDSVAGCGRIGSIRRDGCHAVRRTGGLDYFRGFYEWVRLPTRCPGIARDKAR